MEDERDALERAGARLLEAERVQSVEALRDFRVPEIERADQLVQHDDHPVEIAGRATAQSEIVEPEQAVGRIERAELGDDLLRRARRDRRIHHRERNLQRLTLHGFLSVERLARVSSRTALVPHCNGGARTRGRTNPATC